MSSVANEKYDIAVLGGGPGGYVAAIRAAQLGLKAAVVEREELGGICLNWGCIPSKALLRNAEVLSLMHRAAEFGISVGGEISADYGAAIERAMDRVVATQIRGLHYLMRKHKIDVVRGTGRLTARDRIAVAGGPDGERELAARHIVVATGSRVRSLAGVAIDGRRIISTKEVWGIKDVPRSALIIGAGAIGVEFATVFQAYGVETTVVEFLPRVLPLEDEEMGAEVGKQLARRGVTILTATKVDGADVKGDKVAVRLSPAPGGQATEVRGEYSRGPQQQTTAAGTEGPREILVDRVLLGAGFLPNSGDLGLEALGVALDRRGYIEIDGLMRTNIEGIYAIGDVTGKLPLAHAASAMGEVAAEAIAGHPTRPLDYDAIPRCIYSAPQVAAIGKTEAQAREGGREINIGRFPFRPNGKALALGETEGQAKVIADARTGEILGVHMVGPDVTELIGEFAIARGLEATPLEVARAVHPHPTLSEVIAEAARAVEGEPIHL